MHQKPANGLRPGTVSLALVGPTGEPDPLGTLPLIDEFTRILQDQNRAGRRSKTTARRLKVTSENFALADPIIG